MPFQRRLALPLLLLAFLGCRQPASRVVVYCAHDQEFADAILKEFEKQSGLTINVRYDTEANKSVGLYGDLIREARQPRCDVHWNNEIIKTIQLHQQGVLQAYDSPSAVPYPASCKAKDHGWTAFAARARVVIVNTEKLRAEDFPKSLWDLTEPRFKGRVALAKPMYGTTATQAACLFQAWGKDKARDFYSKLKANGVELVAGNKQVATGVGTGQFALGLTDTDDAVAEIEAGRPVRMLFPERDTLFIPNTVAMIKGCPNPEGAKKLIDYLLSAEVETRLANSGARQFPLNPQVKLDAIKHVEGARSVKALAVDFEKAAECSEESQEFLKKEFGAR